MKSSNLKFYSLALLCGIAGSLLTQFLLSPMVAHAFNKHITTEVITVLAHDGRRRLQLATYSGSYSKAEKGQPLIGFSDSKGKLRLLFRLAGKNESPAIVLKNSKGKDQMVIGLGLNDPEEKPYITFYDKRGRKKNVAWSLFSN